MDFRQGTIGRVEVKFTLVEGGTPVPQPDNLPTVDIIFIDPERLQPATSVQRTIMTEFDPGEYFFNWMIPLDEPTIEHQIYFRGRIGLDDVVGEDTVTVLPASPDCLYTPCVLATTVKGCC